MVGCVLRNEKLEIYVKNYIVDSLGKSFVESIPFDLSKSYAESSLSTPIIFILSVGADPMRYLLDLAREHEKLPSEFTPISLG